MSTDPYSDPPTGGSGRGRAHERDVHGALRAAAAEVRQATAALAPSPRGVAGRGPSAARPGRPRPLLAAVAVAAAVMAVVLGLSTYLGGGTRPSPVGPAGSPTPAPSVSPSASAQDVTPVVTSSDPVVAPLCGPRLPVPVYPPKGWTGPQPGPADDSTGSVLPGQLVVHWSGPGGAVELRWPADPADTSPYDPMESMSTSTDDGRTQLSYPVPGAEPPCAHLRVEWLGSVPEGFGASVDGFTTPEDKAVVAVVTPPEDLRLVSRTRQVATLPRHAIGCSGGDVPNRKSSKDGAPQPSAEQALTAFLDAAGDNGMNRNGWTRLDGPGSEVVFGVPFDGGAGWVQLVFVTEGPNGWVVTGWETSGC
ncbi:hypothetical protein [Kineosporia sp. R_H_3]|uniref:hypothetical protein n=1 Tax=Kineosporia sp. R_H_3 TaxID=1961848 RepID=UPI000B4B6955|nr:hypothetical protein [Kineosporia sp. R_H_3]